ncbi:MAG: hypothetical protein ACE1ZA_04085, partial [Pseudomonadales bacterium]
MNLVGGKFDPNSATIAGNNVFITALTLNINGPVTSGRPDRTLTLLSGLNPDMNDWKMGGNTDLLLLTPAGSSLKAWYNPVTDHIEVETISVQGGYMQLTGAIMSTAQGTLNVMDGFGDIDIDNQTNRQIDIRTIDTGKDRLLKVDGSDTLDFVHNVTGADTITRTNGSWIADGFEGGQRISIVGSIFNDASFRVSTVSAKVLTLVATETLGTEMAGTTTVEVRGHGNGIEGRLIITDTNKPHVDNDGDPETAEVVLTTTFTRIGDDVQVSDNIFGSTTTVLDYTRGSSTLTYDIQDRLRYYWLTGNTTSTVTVEKWVSRSIWGINWLI